MLTDLDLECEVASGRLNTGAVLSISIAIFLVALSTGTLLVTFIYLLLYEKEGKE